MEAIRVLYVEDDPADRELTLRFLRQRAPDLTVRTVGSGREAREALRGERRAFARAITQAVLEELAARGSLCVASTHLEPLKGFAATHAKARNASVEFDGERVRSARQFSRLMDEIRIQRGLAYSVFSGLSAYRDAGSMTIYAGCANEAVDELIDLVIAELRQMKEEPLPDTELRRAKDHLKGSLMLNLESTSSRMSHLARQEIYFDRQFSLDETLEGIERVTPEDIQRVAGELFANGSLAATVLGQVNGLQLPRERLDLN